MIIQGQVCSCFNYITFHTRRGEGINKSSVYWKHSGDLLTDWLLTICLTLTLLLILWWCQSPIWWLVMAVAVVASIVQILVKLVWPVCLGETLTWSHIWWLLTNNSYAPDLNIFTPPPPHQPHICIKILQSPLGPTYHIVTLTPNINIYLQYLQVCSTYNNPQTYDFV